MKHKGVIVGLLVFVIVLGNFFWSVPVNISTVSTASVHGKAPWGPGNTTSSEDGVPGYDAGPVGDNEVIWSPLNNPHIISDNYTVESGWTLIIQPGCDIRFDSDMFLFVLGGLTTDGADVGITFTSNQTAKNPGDWGSIFVAGGFINTMNNCIVEYATNGIYVWSWGMIGAPISDSEIHHNQNYGVYLYEVMGGPSLNNNEIHNNSYGVYSLSSSLMMGGNNIYENTYGVFLGTSPGFGPFSPWLWQNNITHNTMDGVYVDGEWPGFNDNYISFNGRHGIYAQDIPGFGPGFSMIQDNTLENNSNAGLWIDGMNPDIIGNTILNSTYGIYVDDGANPWIFENTIVNKPGWGSCIEFHESSGNISDTTMKNGKFGIWVEPSIVNIYGSTIEDWGMTGIAIEDSSYVWIENSTMTSVSGNCFDLDLDTHVNALNTTFDKQKVNIMDGQSNITVMWWVHIQVNESDGDPAQGAQVWLNNTYGSIVKSGTTDANGRMEWVQIKEYIEGFGAIDYDAHLTTAINNSEFGMNSMNIDSYRTVYIDLGKANYSIQLVDGWNMVSLPLIQSDTSIDIVLNSISGSYEAVQWFDASDTSDPWKHSHISKPPIRNDLNDLDHKMGLWIYMNGLDTLEVDGTRPIITNIQLHKGWNFVGYPSLTTRIHVNALSTIAGKYDAVNSYDASDVLNPWKDDISGDLTEMRPGRGYWIHATQDCLWTVNG